MQDILDALKIAKDEYTVRSGELKALTGSMSEYTNKINDLKLDMQETDMVRALLQQTADSARDNARKLLEDMTTVALQYVFGNTFSARIDMRTLNGRPSADIYVVTDPGNGDVIASKPEDSCGGGIVDIVSIALRISIMQLKNINGPIILDEPGKHVSMDYSVKLAEFLKYISSVFNRQIIFVTHNEDLKATADKSYVASISGGITTMTLSTESGDISEEDLFI